MSIWMLEEAGEGIRSHMDRPWRMPGEMKMIGILMIYFSICPIGMCPIVT